MTAPGMGASIIPFPSLAVREPWLTKRQIADYLGRSTRWVELRVREGMPSKMIGGRRGFKLSEVEAWIDGRNR
jgi:predicted DNA-binding transcriptional regulator AlpA